MAMLRLKPLSPGFGLEACGVDLAQPLDGGGFREIEETFFRAQVLVFRGQSLTPMQFVSFASRFGPPEPHVIDQFHHPVDRNILVLSNRVEDGKPLGLADAGTYFHTDYSYLAVPARATTLYSIEVPAKGGNTLFANQYAAYDALPEAMKQRIEPMVGIHHYGNRKERNDASRTAASPLTDEQKAKMPLITHPLVRRHPVMGRKALYSVSGSSYGIVGMPEDEAVALLDELAAHATQPRFQLSLTYGVGDLVIWDNASLLHAATLLDPCYARTLWRITLKEPAPEGRAAAVLAPTFAQGMM